MKKNINLKINVSNDKQERTLLFLVYKNNIDDVTNFDILLYGLQFTFNLLNKVLSDKTTTQKK